MVSKSSSEIEKSTINGETYLNKRYCLKKELQKSDMCVIWLAVADGKEYALKIYKKF